MSFILKALGISKKKEAEVPVEITESVEKLFPFSDWISIKSSNVKAVADFLEGAAVFAISRMWSDLISSYFLHLHAIPYCGGYLETECTAEASAKVQFVFAAFMALVTGALKYLADVSKLTKRSGMYDDIPTILNYIVGWAFGNAMVKQLTEITSAHPFLCPGGDCAMFNISFSLVVTVIAGAAITLIMPYTTKVECGDGKIIDLIELVLQDVWKMVIRGLSVIVMVLWYYTQSSLVLFKASAADGVQPVVRAHLLLFSAFSMALIGSYLSVILEKLESRTKRLVTKIGASKAVSEQLAKGLLAAIDMIQDTLGYVAGCAFTDLIGEVFDSLGYAPYLSVIVKNIAVTVGITVAVVYWMAAADAEYSISDGTNREEVERYFITNSAAFFVGWTWLTVIRNLFAPFSLLCEVAIVRFNEWSGWTIDPLTGNIMFTLVFLSFFTVWLFNVSSFIMRRLSSATGVAPPPRRMARDFLVDPFSLLPTTSLLMTTTKEPAALL